MALYPPAFAELYVVSDIHMGGHIDGDQSFRVPLQSRRTACGASFARSRSCGRKRTSRCC